MSDGTLSTKLYDKRDYFDFGIVTSLTFAEIYSNFQLMVFIYIAQLIRYTRSCYLYGDFIDRGGLLTKKLVVKVIRLNN